MTAARGIRIIAASLAFALALSAETLPPSDVKVAGAIDYGQTSDELQYTGHPKYTALVFNGESGDRIEVLVKGDRTAAVAIADGTLHVLATGSGHLAFTIPNHGSDPEAYYILFRDAEGQGSRFTVELRKGASKNDQRRSD